MSKVFKCECGYTTHFAKALEAHCRFRHHHPAQESEPETILPEIKEEVVKAVKRTTRKKAESQPTEQTEKKTRKPRAKKTAVKEEQK